MTSGFGTLVERRVGHDAEHAVLAADHAAFVADEGDVDLGDALQHLVWTDAVEGGELGEERDDGLEAHAVLLSGGRLGAIFDTDVGRVNDPVPAIAVTETSPR